METRAWRLRLRAPLHVGDLGIGLEETLDYVPSDTLFSALVVAWTQLAAHAAIAGSLAADFGGRPPLLLTSAMPFVGDLLLFPKPLLSLAPTPSSNESGKRFKRVQWVSQGVFARLCAQPDQSTLDDAWKNAHLLQGGTIWIDMPEWQVARAQGLIGTDDAPLWDSVRVPKVAVDRSANASALFHVGRVHFAEDAGLWFAASGDDVWLKRVEDGLHVLEDAGIGGQRSRGNGQFNLEPIAAPPLQPASGSAHGVLLSRFAPRPAEIALLRSTHAAYRLELVGGFNGTPTDPPLVRKPVRMLAEGSVIALGDGAPGHLVDVTPDVALDDETRPGHRIYRYGFGFTAPIHFKDGGGT